MIGFGARHGEVTRLAQRLEVTGTVRFLGYQPRELLPLSLASGDLHYVGLARGLAGYVVPSRVYGILAAGRPVLVSADAESETVRLVEEAGCGLVVPPGRPELVAGVIRDVVEGRRVARRDGRAGRAWVEREADREVAFDRYRRLVAELAVVEQLAVERVDVVDEPGDGVAAQHALAAEPAHRRASLGVAGEDLEPLRHRVRVARADEEARSRPRRRRPGRHRRSSRPPAVRPRAPR